MTYPYITQRELLACYKDSNEFTHGRMSKLFNAGGYIIEELEVTGPYLTYWTYRFDNGDYFSIVGPSSLHWADIINSDIVYA